MECALIQTHTHTRTQTVGATQRYVVGVVNNFVTLLHLHIAHHIMYITQHNYSCECVCVSVCASVIVFCRCFVCVHHTQLDVRVSYMCIHMSVDRISEATTNLPHRHDNRARAALQRIRCLRC